EAADLAAALGERQAGKRQRSVDEHLREQPGEGEECDRSPKRRPDVKAEYERHDRAQLDESERNRQPSRLIREQAVVDEQVERDADPDHQAGELERPPVRRDGRERRCDEQRREHRDEPRLEPAPQRVRHRFTLRRNPCATYFMPTSVSAAGYVHCEGTPASASVCVSSVSPGTVASGARTIQRSCVSSACSATSPASSGSCAKPRRNPVAQMTWSAP